MSRPDPSRCPEDLFVLEYRLPVGLMRDGEAVWISAMSINLARLALWEIREVIAAQLGLELGKVTRDAMLADDFGVDPLDLLELILRLEISFDIQIPDDALARARTVGDVERFVFKKVTATAF